MLGPRQGPLARPPMRAFCCQSSHIGPCCATRVPSERMNWAWAYLLAAHRPETIRSSCLSSSVITHVSAVLVGQWARFVRVFSPFLNNHEKLGDSRVGRESNAPRHDAFPPRRSGCEHRGAQCRHSDIWPDGSLFLVLTTAPFFLKNLCLRATPSVCVDWEA